MNNSKYIKFMLKALVALIVVLMIPKLFGMVTDPENGLLKSKSGSSAVEQRAASGGSTEYGTVEKKAEETDPQGEDESGPISDSKIGGKIQNYLEDTLTKSGVASESQAKSFIGGIIKTIEGWIKKSDGSELDEILEIESVRDLLVATGVNPDEVNAKSVFDALK